VCGPVVETSYASGSSGKPTFLNLGHSYPDPKSFTIVIWEPNRGNFPPQPEDYYLGSTVCVTGLIETYRGGAQTEGISQHFINILATPTLGPTPTYPTPTRTAIHTPIGTPATPTAISSLQNNTD